jgi:hypothetical protein
MYLAVWLMEHLILIKRWPLILGGPVVDPEVHTDASFASMEERRSVCGHIYTKMWSPIQECSEQM